MNTAHAERVLKHCTAVHEQQQIRVAYLNRRQQWVAHFIGKPAVEGYGRTATEAIEMLKARTA